MERKRMEIKSRREKISATKRKGSQQERGRCLDREHLSHVCVLTCRTVDVREHRDMDTPQHSTE